MPRRSKSRPQVALLIETSNAYARGLLEGVAAYLREHRSWSIYLSEHGRGESVPAAKARSWAIGTVGNIGAAMVKELATGPDVPEDGSDASGAVPADVARRIEGVILGSENELMMLLPPLSDDGGATLRDAFAALKQTTDDRGQTTER